MIGIDGTRKWVLWPVPSESRWYDGLKVPTAGVVLEIPATRGRRITWMRQHVIGHRLKKHVMGHRLLCELINLDWGDFNQILKSRLV